MLDPGAAVCSRCNLPPVGETKATDEEVEAPKVKAKKAKKAKMGKVKKEKKSKK